MNQFVECFKVLYLGFSSTIVFFLHSDVYKTEKVLRMKMVIMEQYYEEHQLIINLKKEKMESVLFGISERSSSHERDRTIARLGRVESARSYLTA